MNPLIVNDSQSSISAFRNLGIMAHIDAGKTTTTERMLFYTGVSNRMGEVHDGASVMDWMQEEQERGISITAASTSFLWNSCNSPGIFHHCNLIDTPGHIDFTVEVERSLRVLDGAVAIFCAKSGVEPQSETVWRQADRHGIPRIAFINKCDRMGADPELVIEQIRKRLGANPIVVQLPHRLESQFNGIVDLVHFRSRVWDENTLGQEFEDCEIPEVLLEEAMLARELMLEALAEVDDSVMEKYLSESEISAVDIVSALRRATIAMRAVPVVMGTALKNKGIQNLLDAVVDYLPSPSDVGSVEGVHPTSGDLVSFLASKDEPVSAIAFKIMNDPKVGVVTYLRVYSGVLKTGVDILNASQDKKEYIGRLVRMHAHHREDVSALQAGDIGAAVGLEYTITGDTLCTSVAPVVLAHITVPEPVASLLLEPLTVGDYDRLRSSLDSVVREDPSLSVQIDSGTGQVVLCGMGELHLEVVVQRLRREFGVQVRSGRPRVAYRECILKTVEHSYLLERGTKQGGGQFAGITLRIKPSELHPLSSNLVSFMKEDHNLIEDLTGVDLNKTFLSAIRSGIADAMQTGPIAGFSLAELKISILKIELHPVDSNEISCKIAAFRCLKEAIVKAAPYIKEPIMDVEIVVPDELVGEVVSDLNARRGKISGIEGRLGVQVVSCLVPLSKMFGYASELRSRTQGRATFSMQLSKYNEVPSGIQDEIVASVSGI